MSQAIASLPPTPRHIDYSAEIPGLEHQTTEFAKFWSGDEELLFADFLDVINSLQHLSVISSIYRAVTGDEISLEARLLGGALFGGPIGILTAGVNAAFKDMSGGNIAEHAVALFEDITGSGDDEPQIALEPESAKTASVSAAVPFAQGGQAVETGSVPVPAAMLPPIKPSTIEPAIPAINNPPPRVTPRQSGMRLPLALNAPSRNSIAQFDGKPADATTRRISKMVLDSQRAQAQLLLASLSGGGENIAKANRVADRSGAAAGQIAGRPKAMAPSRSAALSAIQATARSRPQSSAHGRPIRIFRPAAHPRSGSSRPWSPDHAPFVLNIRAV